MSITIDPSKRKASPASKSVIGGTGGKKVVDMTPKTELERRQRENTGAFVEEESDVNLTKRLVDAMTSASGKPLYGGDPELPHLLDRMMTYITGEKNFNSTVGTGARYGFLGILARRLPSPMLMDNEDVINDLFPKNNHTFCVDPSGRMWVCADFLLKCIKADQTEGLMTLPVLNHEHLHVALNHCRRMHNFDPRISNCAKDAVINPMVKTLYPAGTRFAKDFENAWGNRSEDKRFEGLSEETVATIMQTEAVEALQQKGKIRIKLLEIVDGKVGAQTTHKAGKDEVLDLDHVVITVEELFDDKKRSVGDKIDTEFDCATVEIEQTINRLRTRHRPSGNGGSSSPSVVEIPVESNKPSDDKDPGSPSNGEPKLSGRRRVNPNEDPGAGGTGAFNGNEGHEIDMAKVKEVLKKHGFGDLLDNVIKPDSHDPDHMDVLLEAAMTEAQLERSRLGSYYPGAHINDYMREVVKPAMKHKVNWRQRTMELLQGSGPLLTRSIDEQSSLSLLEPEDLGLDEDEMVYLPGLIPTKPEGRIAVIVDSSGSMDEGRLVEAISLIFAIRKAGNDMSPDIDIYSADTSLRGEPIELTEETMQRFMSEGVGVFGRGGTEITGPLNQLVARAEKEQIKYQAVLYITDFGLMAPEVEDLPKNLPPLVFLGIPADYAASAGVIKKLEEYAEVVSIDKSMNLDMDAAEAKGNVRGNGVKI